MQNAGEFEANPYDSHLSKAQEQSTRKPKLCATGEESSTERAGKHVGVY